MKLALICFSVLTSLSLSFGVQEKAPTLECRGKPGHVDVFVSSFENACGGATLAVMIAPADAVRMPQTGLPIVFREFSAHVY
jgi:hypothetical protein